MATGTATAPAVTREILDDRWRAVTTRCELDNTCPAIPSQGNSKAMNRLMRSLELLAGRMVQEIRTSEEEAWNALQYDLLTTVEEKIKVFAGDIDAARAKAATRWPDHKDRPTPA